MARQTKAKAQKGRNGTGNSVTLFFDRSDPAERKALDAARLLAAKHGRRKQAIIALLEAVYNHYEATGELMSAGAISGALSGQSDATARQPVGFTNAVGFARGPMNPPESSNTPRASNDLNASERPARRHYSSGAGVEVMASGGKASAKNVADNFLSSMKGMASGFFD